MGVYIGVDFHARKQTVSYLTTEDGEIQQIELEHEKDYVRTFYEQFRGQKVIVGFESSGYAAWFEEFVDLHQDFIIGRLRDRNVSEHQGTRLGWGWLLKNPGFHSS